MASSKVAEYFVTVGIDIDDGVITTELLKDEIIAPPCVLDRYPLEETSPFPNGLAMFCFPQGGVGIVEQMEMPKFFDFVCTGSLGSHLYGYVLLVFEPLPTSLYDDRMKQLDKVLYAPKALCVLSSYPFRSQCRIFLTQLYRISLSPINLPLERIISNFISEVPAPPLGKLRVLYQVGDEELIFTRPAPNNPLSWTDLAFEEVFECLSPENILQVVAAVLTERQVIIRSSEFSLMTAMGELIRALIYPFTWDHVYIPVLPLGLMMVLQAPLPYIIGVQDKIFRLAKEQEIWQISASAVIVNMDLNRVSVSSPDYAILQLPEAKKLLTRINLCAPVFSKRSLSWRDDTLPLFDSAIRHAAKPYEVNEESLQEYRRVLEMEDIVTDSSVYKPLPDGQPNWYLVRTAFFRYFVSLLRDYRDFMIYPEQKPEKRGIRISQEQRKKELGSFDAQNFLNKRKRLEKPFMARLVETQHFSTFINCQLHPDGARDTDVMFFEQSLVSKYGNNVLSKLIPGMKADTPFLQDRRYAITKTVVALQPDNSPSPEIVNGVEWMPHGHCRGFDAFPRLHEELYGAIRPIPEMPDMDNTASVNSKGRGVIYGHPADKQASALDTIFAVWFMLYSFALGKSTPYTKALVEYESKYGRVQDILGDAQSEGTISDHEELLSSDEDAVPPRRNGSMDASNRRIKMGSRQSSRFRNSASTLFRRQSTVRLAPHLQDYEFERLERIYDKLDVAFDIYNKTKIQSRDISELIFRCLIEVCGRIGHIDYAIQVLGMMHKQGIKPDSQVYANLVQSFSMNGDVDQSLKLDVLNWETLKPQVEAATQRIRESRGSSMAAADASASSALVQRGPTFDVKRSWQIWGARLGSSNYESNGLSQTNSSSAIKTSSMSEKAKGILQSISMFNMKKPSSTVSAMDETHDGVYEEGQMDNMIELKWLEGIFPDLIINLDQETCYKCRYDMTDENIRMGWGRDPNDYTTTCPKCLRKFVARFTVKSSRKDWQGSRGQGTELYCEYLPPWALEKEVRLLLLNNMASFICSNKFREAKPTVFWNIIVYFKELNLPLGFLLGPPPEPARESGRPSNLARADTSSRKIRRDSGASQSSHESATRRASEPIDSKIFRLEDVTLNIFDRESVNTVSDANPTAGKEEPTQSNGETESDNKLELQTIEEATVEPQTPLAIEAGVASNVIS